MEDYKTKFEKLIQRIYDLTVSGCIDEKVGKAIMKDFMVESEDDRIRKALIESFEINDLKALIIPGFSAKDVIAWFEKKGERKQNVTDIISDLENYFATTTKEQQEEDWNELKKWEEKYFNHDKHIENSPDKVEPKFKVGDWCIDNEDNTTFQITKVLSNLYYYRTNEGTEYSCPRYSIEHDTHLWTIRDAKDGDVLYSEEGAGVESIHLVSRWKKVDGENTLCSVCTYRIEDDEIITGGLGAIWWHGVQDLFSPATKEQRDLLFSKMKEAGYEWDPEKKELKQIEQKPTDKIEPKFKVGDWVIYECGEDSATLQIKNIVDGTYEFTDDSTLNVVDENTLRLWTIQDAKDGDVLANDHHILILKELGHTWASNGKPECLYAYCGIKPNGNFELEKENYCFCGILHIHPATKGQRDLLFSKMKEAGYEWDTEKKELKKFEQEEDAELTDFESALFSAFSDAWQEYLIGEEVDVAKWAREHSAELLEVAREQNSAWSEEDERMINDIIEAIDKRYAVSDYKEMVTYLKALKERYAWKPSVEQMEVLHRYAEQNNYDGSVLTSLYRELKKLKKE